MIVFGPKETARFTIDIGKSKTVGDYLAMKGRAYAAVLGPTINYVLQYRKFGYLPRPSSLRDQRAFAMPTKIEIVEAAGEIEGIDISVEFTAPAMKTLRMHSVLAFCHKVFWSKTRRREDADTFITQLITGEGLRRDSPILVCRNRLLRMAGGRANEKSEVIFKAWNAWRRNESLASFRISGGKLPKVEA